MASKRTTALEAMIEKAIVDAYGDDEQRIGLLDLPLPAPPPDGAMRIDAHRHWAVR